MVGLDRMLIAIKELDSRFFFLHRAAGAKGHSGLFVRFSHPREHGRMAEMRWAGGDFL
jgi:hypothetical protein